MPSNNCQQQDIDVSSVAIHSASAHHPSAVNCGKKQYLEVAPSCSSNAVNCEENNTQLGVAHTSQKPVKQAVRAMPVCMKSAMCRQFD